MIPLPPIVWQGTYAHTSQLHFILLTYINEQICLTHCKYRLYWPHAERSYMAHFFYINMPKQPTAAAPLLLCARNKYALKCMYMPYIWHEYMEHVCTYICHVKPLAWIMLPIAVYTYLTHITEQTLLPHVNLAHTSIILNGHVVSTFLQIRQNTATCNI